MTRGRRWWEPFALQGALAAGTTAVEQTHSTTTKRLDDAHAVLASLGA